MRLPVFANLLVALGMSLCGIFNCETLADIHIDDYTPAKHNRFTNDLSFIAASFDLSGVARGSGGRWATLISPNVAVTANHLIPNTPLYFYSGNDSSQMAEVRTIVSSVRIPGTDIQLLTLNSSLPTNFKYYDIPTLSLEVAMPTPNTLYSAGSFQDLNAYTFGISPTSGATQNRQAVGRNRITGYVENVVWGGRTNADMLYLEYDASPNPTPDPSKYVEGESFFRSGDSGAPLFVEFLPGELLLLGINSVVFQQDISVDPNIKTIVTVAGGVSYLGNHSTFIKSYIISASSIPEPAASTLVGFISLVVLFRRRRNG